MNSKTASSNANTSAVEEYTPVDGSWVVELEEAKEALAAIDGMSE
jgi:hypothetical protein